MRLKVIACFVIALASTACFGLDELFKSPTSSTESSSAPRSYIGIWTGPALSASAGSQTCGGFQWKITMQTTTQITGDFTAACGGGITLAGTVLATVTDSTTIPWAASGNATQGAASCTFNLTGTGTFQGTSNILITYVGKACGVDVSGSQTITRS